MTLPYNTLVVLAGVSLLGACAGLVGTFAVLRRRALMGDALAHAALPGLCLAFLIVGERHLPALLAGAFCTGLLGVAVVAVLRRATRVKEDAAIGIVLSMFYGAGIVLSVWIQNSVTQASKAGLDSYILGKASGILRQDIVLVGGVSLVCLGLIALFYKEFKLIAFDTDFAEVQGWPAVGLDFLLMAMIALTVIIGLPMVGVVLIAALLIIPGAAARFWTERLGTLLLLSAVMGMLIGAGGAIPSHLIRGLPGGPPIVLVGAGVFVISLLFAPRRGVLARVVADRRFRRKVAAQNLLRALYELYEAGLPQPAPVTVADIQQQKAWDHRHIAATLNHLQAAGLVERVDDQSWSLTEGGLRRAAAIVRSFRLWELFLNEHAETAGSYADLDLDSLDARLPREVLQELEAKLQADGLN